jgi:hypothetical protein
VATLRLAECGLSLQKSDYMRNGVFGRDRDQHVHIVWHQAPFLYPATFLQASPDEQITQLKAKVAIRLFRAVLAGKTHLIMAVPSGMCKMVIVHYNLWASI